MGTRRDWLVRAWAVALAVLLLGPALGVGYVLSYDMVWVPDLALRPEFLGLGSGLPRAVPSDAVVAVLDEVVPGMLLQKVVLLGSLVAAGLGAARLAPAGSLVARLAAVSLVEWNPFVAERLLMGHWPVLLGYAVLPWLVLAVSRGRTAGRVPRAVWWLLPLGSLSAGAGLVSAVVLLAFGTTWRSARSVAVSARPGAGRERAVAGVRPAARLDRHLRRRRRGGLRAPGGGRRCRRRSRPSVSAGSGTRRWCRGRAPGCWPGSRWWCWSSSPRSGRGPGRRRGAVGTCWPRPAAGCWAGAWPP